MRHFSLCFGVFLAASFFPIICSGQTVVGSIKTAEGKPVVERQGLEYPATPGFQLQLKDTVRTDDASRVGFMLQDGARVSLGPGSEIRVEEFVFEPSKGEFGSLLNLLRGVAAFASGRINKISPGASKVQTPVAMIGMRGTRFAADLGER